MNIENNKIIAEFLGYELEETMNEKVFVYAIPTTNNNTDFFKPNELLFHSDWNWLMKVVEKIESLDYNFNITSGDATALHYHCAIYQTSIYRIDGTTKIQATYETVIEFIKWYNLQK